MTNLSKLKKQELALRINAEDYKDEMARKAFERSRKRNTPPKPEPEMVYVVTNQHGVVLFVTRDKDKAMKCPRLVSDKRTVTAHQLED